MHNHFLKTLYSDSLGLLTDLYELMMAYGYWKQGIADRQSIFQLFFRRNPFNASFAICAGMETALEFIRNFRFDTSDLEYLASLKEAGGRPIFEPAFLSILASLKIELTIDAMPEGTPVCPYEPLIRVEGPLLQAQLMEPALLNIINFQSLIATKASRVCWAARPDEVVEFGLRRAQGIDGAISASRAAYIGGCHATSHVLAGKLFGIPVMGTHAHSWVMSYESEKEAFSAFAKVFPKTCMFLIDTYDTIEGARNAVEVGNSLRAQGIELRGVRLDSGDLAHLSRHVRAILDAGGFKEAKIMASNELDEIIIQNLKQQEAKITLWGVGTNLITARDQPVLDGVYKLSAIQDEKGDWSYRLKISDQMSKTTNPGIPQIRRYFDEKGAVCDMLYDIGIPLPDNPVILQHLDPTNTRKVQPHWQWQDLLIPMMKKGKSVYETPPLSAMREATYKNLERFDPAIRRFLNPALYFSGIEQGLFDMKLQIVEQYESASHRRHTK